MWIYFWATFIDIWRFLSGHSAPLNSDHLMMLVPVMYLPIFEFYFFFKWDIPDLFFFILVFSMQLMVVKICQWRDSNRRSLILLTEPQTLPNGPPHLLICHQRAVHKRTTMLAHWNLKQNMWLCSKQSSCFPFMHCPLVANRKTQWSIELYFSSWFLLFWTKRLQ